MKEVGGTIFNKEEATSPRREEKGESQRKLRKEKDITKKKHKKDNLAGTDQGAFFSNLGKKSLKGCKSAKNWTMGGGKR